MTTSSDKFYISVETDILATVEVRLLFPEKR